MKSSVRHAVGVGRDDDPDAGLDRQARRRGAQVEAARVRVDLEERAVLDDRPRSPPRGRSRTDRASPAAAPTDGRSRRRAGLDAAATSRAVMRSAVEALALVHGGDDPVERLQHLVRVASVASLITSTSTPASRWKLVRQRGGVLADALGVRQALRPASSPMPMPTPVRVVGDREVLVPALHAPRLAISAIEPCPSEAVVCECRSPLMSSELDQARELARCAPARARRCSRAPPAGSASSRGTRTPRPRRPCGARRRSRSSVDAPLRDRQAAGHRLLAHRDVVGLRAR